MPSKLIAPASNDTGGLQPPPDWQAKLPVDPNNLVIVGGTVRAGDNQKVELIVKTDGESDKTYILTGQGTRNAVLKTPNGDLSIVLPPSDKSQSIEFYFYHQNGYGEWVKSNLLQTCFDKDEQFDRPKFVQLYYFRTEDWIDDDYNDSVVVVNVLPDRES